MKCVLDFLPFITMIVFLVIYVGCLIKAAKDKLKKYEENNSYKKTKTKCQ